MNSEQLNELLLQALEHEMGGVKVYETALKCVLNEDLQEEWQKYLRGDSSARRNSPEYLSRHGAQSRSGNAWPEDRPA